MKKQILVMASAAFLLASCGGETKTEDAGQTQAQIDSAINAQAAEHEAEKARAIDSTVQAEAAARAAAEAAEAAKKSGGKKSTTKTPKAEPASPAPPPPPPPPPSGGLRGRSDQSQSGTGTEAKPASGGGLRGRSDQSQK
jgi:septal ring factor EnvC (AmiA/AmiB activator)